MITPKPATVFDLFNGHPERWLQGDSSQDASGRSLVPYDDNAVCWCILGAISFVNTPNYSQMSLKMRKALGGSVVLFNDAPSTTFDMMLAKVKEAGI